MKNAWYDPKSWINIGRMSLDVGDGSEAVLFQLPTVRLVRAGMLKSTVHESG